MLVQYSKLSVLKDGTSLGSDVLIHYVQFTYCCSWFFGLFKFRTTQMLHPCALLIMDKKSGQGRRRVREKDKNGLLTPNLFEHKGVKKGGGRGGRKYKQ